MNIVFSLLFFLSTSAFASEDCPLPLTVDGTDYCADLVWIPGEKKEKGQFVPTSEESPYLIPMKEKASKWIYSQALIDVWEKGDSNLTPVQIPGFNVFTYMFMNSGHHHPGDNDQFYYDSSVSAYRLKTVTFHSMPGCWSLRWNTTGVKAESSSSELLQITEYANSTDSGCM